VNDNIEDIYELSPLQQGMLFHSIYEPDSRAYFEQISMPFYGRLDSRAFTLAWERIADRHTVLRTSFHWEHIDKPVQVVHRGVRIPIDWQDWSNSSPMVRARRLAGYLNKDRDTRFDISRAPLMRLGVIRFSEEEFRIIPSFHHILLDGWSYQLLEEELWKLYEGFCSGQPTILEPVRPYSDYIGWLQKQDLANAENFWRQSLQGFTAPTTFASVYREAGVESDPANAEHASFEIQLSPESTQALQTLARKHRLTTNTLVLGAWAIQLSRYCGEQDVLFGAVVSGRPAELPGVESMVGLFINTLPLRVAVPADDLFIPWLQRLQKLQLEVRKYEYSPMLKIQQWSDVALRVPLFDSIVVFENFPSGADPRLGEDDGTEESPLYDSNSADEMGDFSLPEGTNYPLCVLAIPGSRLMFRFHYQQRALARLTIEQIATHLRTLLENIAVDADRRLRDLSCLTKEEETRILISWNATEKVYPRDHSLAQLFEEQAEATPDARAFVCDGEELSFRSLNCKANRLAHYLRERGLAPESLVGICLERSLDLPVAFLAVLKAGLAYLPLDPSYSRERLAFILRDSGAATVISEDRFAPIFSAADLDTVWIDKNRDAIARYQDTNLPHVWSPEQLAYVIYTSGSTGVPKGVMVEYEQILNRLYWMWDAYPFTANEVCCQRTALNFVDSIWELLGPLLRGVPTLILSDEVLKDLDALVRALGSARVSRIWVVPSLLEVLVDTYPDLKDRLPALNFWVSSGEALSTRLLRRFSEAMPDSVLYNLYGTSEVWDATWYDSRDMHGQASRVPIGRPISNVQTYVLDAWLRPVAVGVVGELCIGGIGLARGYVNLPTLTAEKFVPDPFHIRKNARLYRTGDLARYLPDGNIEILGRTDHQIKVRGIRIELEEVEAAMNQFPDIRRAIVISSDQKNGDRGLLAYITANSQSEYTDRAAERIAQWKEIWDEMYAQNPSKDDGSDDFAGWINSYTGTQVPEDEMREYVECLASRVLELRPSCVLDVGCGTGLLASRIASQVHQYCAADLSSQALHRFEKYLSKNMDSKVSLVHCAAEDFTNFAPASFDTIVLNSVAQYFPNIYYLLRVIDGALKVLKPGGNIFVGDVRNLMLLEAFHTSVELHRASPSLSLAELRYRAQRKMSEDDQLAIDPDFFRSLGKRFPRICSVQIQPKQGRYRNEFTRFRYDVTLHTGDGGAVSQYAWRDWQRERLTNSQIRDLLLKRPEYLALGHVLSAEMAINKDCVAQQTQSDSATVSELRHALNTAPVAPGINLEALSTLAYPLSYRVCSNWSGPEAPDCFDVLFERNDIVAQKRSPFPEVGSNRVLDARSYANDPLESEWQGKMIRDLREFLRQKLPEHMIPSAFTVVQSFPLTPNGKIDRAALPQAKPSYSLLERPFLAPCTPTEEALTHIWQQVLAIEHLGVADNFFDLGGHSLTATRVLSRVRDHFQIDLTLRSIFDHPTVATLAQCIDEWVAGAVESGMPPIRPLPRQPYAAFADSTGSAERTQRSRRAF
jgi:amino acid adenylation domain-containing protein